MAEDIRLAKGEDVDKLREQLEEKVDKSELESDGYLKKKIVGALPSVSAEFDFEDGISKFNAVNRCTAAVAKDDNNNYQKITTVSNAANEFAFATFDLSSYTTAAKNIIIEFDSKIGGDRWFIGLSDLSKRPGESYRTDYDHSGVLFFQGTKDGSYYYVNTERTEKTTFFKVWVHSKIEVDFESKKVSYEISNGNADKISGTIDFVDADTEQLTAIEIFSYVNSVEMGIDNIRLTAKLGDDIDVRTMYIISDNDVFSEYIYIDGKPVLIGRSDIVKTVNDLLERVSKLESE
jgi:hypothetical protein